MLYIYSIEKHITPTQVFYEFHLIVEASHPNLEYVVSKNMHFYQCISLDSSKRIWSIAITGAWSEMYNKPISLALFLVKLAKAKLNCPNQVKHVE